MTSKSLFSSATASSPAPPAAGAAAAATGAAAVTPNFSSNFLEQFAQFDDGKLRDAIKNLLLGQGCSHGDSFIYLLRCRLFGRFARGVARRLRGVGFGVRHGGFVRDLRDHGRGVVALCGSSFLDPGRSLGDHFGLDDLGSDNNATL